MTEINIFLYIAMIIFLILMNYTVDTLEKKIRSLEKMMVSIFVYLHKKDNSTPQEICDMYNEYAKGEADITKKKEV